MNWDARAVSQPAPGGTAVQAREAVNTSAENAEPQTFEVEVKQSGEWHNDEAAMRARGIQIDEVRPVEPAPS